MCKNFYWSFFRNTGALCRKACAWIPDEQYEKRGLRNGRNQVCPGK